MLPLFAKTITINTATYHNQHHHDHHPAPICHSPRTASGGRKTCRPPPRTWAAPRCRGCTPPPLRGPCTPRSRCTGWTTGSCLGAGGCSCGCRRPVMRVRRGRDAGSGGWGALAPGGGAASPHKSTNNRKPLLYL